MSGSGTMRTGYWVLWVQWSTYIQARGGGGKGGGGEVKHRHTNWRGSMLICGAGGFSRLNSILDDISNLSGVRGMYLQVPSIAGGIGLKSLRHGVERGTYCVLMFAFGVLVGRVRVYGRRLGGGRGGEACLELLFSRLGSRRRSYVLGAT